MVEIRDCIKKKKKNVFCGPPERVPEKSHGEEVIHH
jgi:hypothetical protein